MYFRANGAYARRLVLTTILREEFVFEVSDGNDLSELVNFLIDGLKQKSQYVVAIQDYSSTSEYKKSYCID